jgi:hypothetical protein
VDDFYTALQRHCGAAPLAGFATAFNKQGADGRSRRAELSDQCIDLLFNGVSLLSVSVGFQCSLPEMRTYTEHTPMFVKRRPAPHGRTNETKDAKNGLESGV